MFIDGISLSEERPESLTQAYHAGQILSLLETYLPNEAIPSFLAFVIQFYALRELLGERLYQKIKSHHKFRARVRIYELLTYQPQLPSWCRGTFRDFCLGYVKSYNKSKHKIDADAIRRTDIQKVLDYLKT